MKIELCAASLQAVLFADTYNFDRIELCQALENGGITPSIGFQKKALQLFPNTHVLIRCREGNFIYSDPEKEIMLHDIAETTKISIPGVVVGSLTKDLNIDLDFIREVKKSFPALEITFHRAFDDVTDPLKALDDLISLGVRRVLTSGGKTSVFEGIKQLNTCFSYAKGKIEIMAGGGINEKNIRSILNSTRMDAIHFSGTILSKKDTHSLFDTELMQVNETKIEAILNEIRNFKNKI